MLFHRVFLAAAAVATAYAGPCKPVSSRVSVSSSADASIPLSTVSIDVSSTTRTATSESSGAGEVTSSVTAEDITTGTTDANPTTEPTTDGTTDTVVTGTATTDSPTTIPTTEGTTTESTTAAPTSTSEFCYDNAYVISMLAFDPVASPFCVSYLSMTTHTITDYATPTTDPATTNTGLSEVTVTSTRSVDTITCLDTAYSYVAPVPTIDRGSPHPDKRGQDEIEVPEAIPSDWTEAQTSDICSCLDLEEPTAHTTVTETSTVTAWVVETTLADNNDIAYRRFDCPFDANIYDDGFGINYFKGKPVLSSGNGQTQFVACGSLTLGTSDTFDPSQAALLYNAYFHAKETGTYTFSIPDDIDNWGYLWVEDAAYTWDSGAWAIEGTRTGGDSSLWKSGSYEIQLNKGDAIPFTYLWANGGGCGISDLRVTTPSGESILGLVGSTVEACDLDKFT